MDVEYFDDKKGRRIRIEVDECAYAYHDGKKIGDVLTSGPREVDHNVPDLPPRITGWEVDVAYRRSGICEEMVRLLYERWGMMEPADKNVGIGDQNALTDEGMAITRRCQEKGYVAPFEDEQPPSSDDEEY